MPTRTPVVVTVLAAALVGCWIGYRIGLKTGLEQPVPSPTTTAATATAPGTCKLLAVIDGDTIKVMWNGEPTSVRLLNVNAPDRGQDGFEQATAAMEELLGEGLNGEIRAGQVSPTT